jgi:hypothetical protein
MLFKVFSRSTVAAYYKQVSKSDLFFTPIIIVIIKRILLFREYLETIRIISLYSVIYSVRGDYIYIIL